MKDVKEWLIANPIARLVLSRVVMALLGALVGVLATLGLVPPELVAQLAG